LVRRRPPTSTPFPYTTLFRSHEPVIAGKVSAFEAAVGFKDRPSMGFVGRLKPYAESCHCPSPQTCVRHLPQRSLGFELGVRPARDRKRTRLNSSHSLTSYAVF